MMSSNETGGPLPCGRRSGAAATAQAAEAQADKMARFSLRVRSVSATTSRGCPYAPAGWRSLSRSNVSFLTSSVIATCSQEDMDTRRRGRRGVLRRSRVLDFQVGGDEKIDRAVVHRDNFRRS